MIASRLGAGNRARLAATSRDWRATSRVTPAERKRGERLNAMRRLIVAVIAAIKNWDANVLAPKATGPYSHRKGSLRIGGFSPRHEYNGLRAEIDFEQWLTKPDRVFRQEWMCWINEAGRTETTMYILVENIDGKISSSVTGEMRRTAIPLLIRAGLRPMKP